MISLEHNYDDERRERESVKVEHPKFPPGLRIHLDDETLKKLGIKKLPEAGVKVEFVAVAEVAEVGMNDEDKMHMSLQIQEMAIKPKKNDVEKEVEAFYGE